MNRRCFSGAVSVAAGVMGVNAKAAVKTSRPNLLFIMTDQQRFDAMSCAGNTVLETPNMDRLAREGVMFKNAYSANPVCVPSRAVFLTGLSPVNVRVEGNGDYTSEDIPDVPTFDSVIKAQGADGPSLLIDQLKSDSLAMRNVGLRAAREIQGSKVSSALASQLKKSPPEVQALLIKALVDRNDPTACKGIEKLAGSKNAD